MKNVKQNKNNNKRYLKKKYEKPKINHSTRIETLAETCTNNVGCVPSNPLT